MLKFFTSLLLLIGIVIVTNCVICVRNVEAIKHFESPVYNSDSEKSSLHQDLCDFLSIIPVEDIRNLTKHFYANDYAMRESYDYLRDEGYRKSLETLSKINIFQKFTNFLKDSSVDFADLKKRIEKIVLTKEETDSIAFVGVNDHFDGEFDDGSGSDEVTETANKKVGLGGINSFFSETLLLIPQDEILTLFLTKMEQSKNFATFLSGLSASDYENLFENLKQSQGIQMLYFELHSHGIDILEWSKSLKSFFGY